METNPVPVSFSFEVVKLCPYCHHSMQIAEKLFKENGDLLAIRFVCACRGSIYHENVHATQLEERKI
jgi:hypothetical protein